MITRHILEFFLITCVFVVKGLTNAYYVMYEGINDTASNLLQEINQGAECKGISGAIGGALRQLPSTALAPIVLTTEAILVIS